MLIEMEKYYQTKSKYKNNKLKSQNKVVICSCRMERLL